VVDGYVGRACSGSTPSGSSATPGLSASWCGCGGGDLGFGRSWLMILVMVVVLGDRLYRLGQRGGRVRIDVLPDII